MHEVGESVVGEEETTSKDIGNHGKMYDHNNGKKKKKISGCRAGTLLGRGLLKNSWCAFRNGIA